MLNPKKHRFSCWNRILMKSTSWDISTSILVAAILDFQPPFWWNIILSRSVGSLDPKNMGYPLKSRHHLVWGLRYNVKSLGCVYSPDRLSRGIHGRNHAHNPVWTRSSLNFQKSTWTYLWGITKGIFHIYHSSIVWIVRHLGCVYTPGVLSRVKIVGVANSGSVFFWNMLSFNNMLREITFLKSVFST